MKIRNYNVVLNDGSVIIYDKDNEVVYEDDWTWEDLNLWAANAAQIGSSLTDYLYQVILDNIEVLFEAEEMLPNVTNVSNCMSSEVYNHIIDAVAIRYPSWNFVVDGGSYRFHDCAYEIDEDTKTIKVDFYLWNYIDTRECVKWLLSEFKQKIKEPASVVG